MPKRKPGASRKAIRLDVLKGCARICCTVEEAAAVLGVSKPTLERRLRVKRFREAWEQGLAEGRAVLRRKQFELASDGCKTMLIWLGKQLLGQRDAVSTEISGAPGGEPVQFVVTLPERAENATEWAKRFKPPAEGE